MLDLWLSTATVKVGCSHLCKLHLGAQTYCGDECILKVYYRLAVCCFCLLIAFVRNNIINKQCL